MAESEKEPESEPEPKTAEPTVDDLRAALAERERELSKRARDQERLEKIAAKYDATLKGEETAKRKRAEEQGEWRRLHDEAEARASAVAAERDALAERLSTYEAHIRSQVESSLASIEDVETRKRISAAIDGLEPTRAHSVVAAMLAAIGERAPASPKAGAAGRPRGHKVGVADLMDRGSKGETLRLQSTLAALRAGGVLGGER